MRKRKSRPAPNSNNGPRTAPSWNYYVAASAVCCFLVAGFFLAARQHFSSIDFGIKNSRLRRQLDELQSEKRRLLLNKEVAMSPSEVRKAAKKIGYNEAAQSQTISANSAPAEAQKISERVVEGSPSGAKTRPNKVVPTVMVEPVNRPAKQDRQAQLMTAKERRDRT